MARRLKIFILGAPRGKQRARSGQGRHYTPKETVDAERLIAWAAKKAMAGEPLFDGPVGIDIDAVFDYPASWSKRRRENTHWKTSKPDVDNIAKLVCDALNGVVWRDDSQLVLQNSMKSYITDKYAEGLHIEVYEP